MFFLRHTPYPTERKYNMTEEKQEKEFNKEKSRADINRYLRDYRRTYSMLKSSSLTRKYSGEDAYRADADEAVFRARMFEIRAFVLSIEQTPEKMLLYYYYIKGFTLDKCAKILGISRRSVYRLKIKALDLALQKYLTL